MARKIFKWIAIGLGLVVGLVVIAGIVVFFISNGRMNKRYDIATANLSIPSDETSIEEGARLVAIRGCVDCHGDNFGGEMILDDPAFGTFYASNITSGSGSATASYIPADWDRVIRHGVGRDGMPVLVMPSTDYFRISDEDLEMMIAYLEALPPVDQSWPESTVGPLARVLITTGQIDLAAEVIDHNNPPPANIVAEVSANYGEYLATTCTGCHGFDFSGGPILGAPPENPAPANLTPAGNLANWTQDDFINTLRTGTTPEGKQLNPAYMPWPIADRMTDDELAALWLYLSTLEPVATDS